MPRHEQVSNPMTRASARPGLALLLTSALMGASGLAFAQPASPGVPTAASPPVPAMVQAPTAPVPPSPPAAAIIAGAASGATAPTAVAPIGTALTDTTFQSKVGKEKAVKIESRIARLHAALRITPQQEPLWQDFASVMRQNVVQLDAVYARRENQYGAMNAVQDLQSYAEVQEANAHNVQMLLPPFQALYDSLSPDQKKAADTAFLHNTNKALQKSG